MNEGRRLLVTGGLAVIAGMAGRAQAAPSPGRTYSVGVLFGDGPEDTVKTAAFKSFKAALALRGYVEGKNLSIESRFAEGQVDRFTTDAAALVQKKVDILIAMGTPSTRAAQYITQQIPIFAFSASDPVRHGFAASLVRPGKNVTGVTNSGIDTGLKRLQLLAKLAPRVERIGFIINPDNPAHVSMNFDARAAAMSLQAVRIPIRKPEEVERQLEAHQGRVDAIVVSADFGVLNALLPRFASFALSQRYPSTAQACSFVDSGGLSSYGHDRNEQWRIASEYVVKILNGANPGELPFVEASQFELCLNRRTAKAIGVTIPQDMLFGANLVVG